MTPEELQRTIDFILAHQAQCAAKLDQFAAAIEEERKERLKDRPRLARVESAFVKLTELVEIQSRRPDSHDQEFNALLKLAQERHDETINQLKQILDRLPGKN
jgi:pantothenate kinase